MYSGVGQAVAQKYALAALYFPLREVRLIWAHKNAKTLWSMKLESSHHYFRALNSSFARVRLRAAQRFQGQFLNFLPLFSAIRRCWRPRAHTTPEQVRAREPGRPLAAPVTFARRCAGTLSLLSDVSSDPFQRRLYREFLLV